MDEVDSDVNEDRGREWLLDESFDEWYVQMENQVNREKEITRVPEDNVFEAAIEEDKAPETL